MIFYVRPVLFVITVHVILFIYLMFMLLNHWFHNLESLHDCFRLKLARSSRYIVTREPSQQPTSEFHYLLKAKFRDTCYLTRLL